MNTAKQKGFTLIEILVVIGLIAILATIVLIAINPARQFAQARNTQRESNVNTILNAIGQRVADNKGLWTAVTGCDALPSASSTISSAATDLSCLVPTYIPSQLPLDPAGGEWDSSSDYDTKYSVTQDSSTGRVTVCAANYNESSLGSPGPFCLTR